MVLRHNEGFCAFVRTLGQYGALNREVVVAIKEGRLSWTFPSGSHRKDVVGRYPQLFVHAVDVKTPPSSHF